MKYLEKIQKHAILIIVVLFMSLIWSLTSSCSRSERNAFNEAVDKVDEKLRDQRAANVLLQGTEDHFTGCSTSCTSEGSLVTLAIISEHLESIRR